MQLGGTATEFGDNSDNLQPFCYRIASFWHALAARADIACKGQFL
jgi:hypothetical protein